MRNVPRTAIRTYLLARARPTYEPHERHLWIIRPDHLGDLLFLTPGLRRLREALPDWHITLVVGPWSRAVAEKNLNVDEILCVPFPGFTRDSGGSPWQPYRQLIEDAGMLREARPAAVIVLRDDHWWAGLLARVAGAPTIIGAEHPAMNGLLTNSVHVHGSHWVARNVEVLEFAARLLQGKTGDQVPTPALDPLQWDVSDPDRLAASDLLRSSGIGRRFAVIHSGSGAPVKLWPAERWAQVADALAADGYDVVLTGSEAERPLVARILDAAQSKPVPVTGQTTIGILAATYEQAQVVAGVDSGPLHLAVAVNAPSVHIYGPSDVDAYGPWGDPIRHRVVRADLCCPRCGDLSLLRPQGAGCMTAVPVESVLESIRNLLSIHA